MAKKKRTKYVRTFTHPCDDFTITDDDGNEYYPHAGESVTFRSDLPWRLVALPDPGDSPRNYCEALIAVLRRQIRGWDWTDDDGEPLPRPAEDYAGFVEALWHVSAEEREYLKDRCWDSSKLGEA
jgi:hypothetical protein